MGKRSRVKAEDQSQQVSLEMDRMWRPVFDQFDTNLDGRISLDELKRHLHEGNSHLGEELPREVVEEILERADWDKNRVLTYDEFLHMIHARDLGANHPNFRQLIQYAAIAVVPKNQRSTTVRQYLDEFSCMPPPIFLILISLIEVVVFVYYAVEMGEVTATGPVPFDSVLIYNPHLRQEAWRFLTYAFIHAGIIHLVFNVIIQLILGVPLEMVHKWWRVGAVYMGGVVAGSLGASVSDPYSYLAGASGGVYALIAGKS